jgi:hypothetical protein
MTKLQSLNGESFLPINLRLPHHNLNNNDVLMSLLPSKIIYWNNYSAKFYFNATIF